MSSSEIFTSISVDDEVFDDRTFHYFDRRQIACLSPNRSRNDAFAPFGEAASNPRRLGVTRRRPSIISVRLRNYAHLGRRRHLSTGAKMTLAVKSSSSSSSCRFRFFVLVIVASVVILAMMTLLTERDPTGVTPRGSLVSTSGCRILDFDPFHASVASFFRMKPERKICTKPRTAFKTEGNVLYVDPLLIKRYKIRSCSYIIIVPGVKKKDLRAVRFDPKTRVTLNASYVRASCVKASTFVVGDPTVFGSYVTLAWRDPEKAVIKAEARANWTEREITRWDEEWGAEIGEVKEEKGGKRGKGEGKKKAENSTGISRSKSGNASSSSTSASSSSSSPTSAEPFTTPSPSPPSTPPPPPQLPPGPRPSPPWFNVHIVGIDSASRLNSIRFLPKTRDFLLRDLKAREFYGYNKVGLNTIPNWIPLFTGRPKPVNMSKPFRSNFVWKGYARRGYWTLFGDDWDASKWAWDFDNSDIDHVYKPLAKAMSIPGHSPCLRGRLYGEVVYDWYLKNLEAHRGLNDSLFTFVWTTDWAHEDINLLKRADGPTLDLLKKMKSGGYLNDSVLIFLSDHGLRRSKFVTTWLGKHESSLPFLFIVFPPWFRRRFPEAVASARVNGRRLVTAYDLHRTLEHLLHLATSAAPWRDEEAEREEAEKNDDSAANGESTTTTQAPTDIPPLTRVPGAPPLPKSILPSTSAPSVKLPRSYSLLQTIPDDRTCVSAGIPLAFCSCHSAERLDPKSREAADAAAVLVDHINSKLRKHQDLCARFSVSAVKKSFRVVRKPHEVFLVVVQASPGGAIFEATLEKRVSSSGKVEYRPDMSAVGRLDTYGNTSACIIRRDFTLKEFCYCV